MPEVALHQQAFRLLAGSASPEALLQLGLDCHGHMLALADTDRPEAIRLALAGAALFERLLTVHAPQPAWVGTHEEQCCRFGAIWIHELFAAGGDGESSWCQRAVDLLDRMESHHTRPVPWAETMRRELRQVQLQRFPPALKVGPPPGEQHLVDLLHLHGFKCAGSTFIGALEHATAGQLLYVETPEAHQRLPWQRVRDHLGSLPAWPRAITSHLITLPPPGDLARLKVAFLRDPLARLASAYRFQRHVQNNLEPMAFSAYLEQVCRGPLANYQTRHLSPQEPEDWQQRQGWAARPERIDLQRADLFVGLVERYDDSILALEHQLELLGCPLDLAYPQRLNTTAAHDDGSADAGGAPREAILQATELDASLYRRAAARLEARLAAIPDLEARRQHFEARCRRLRRQPSPHAIQPTTAWTRLPAHPLPWS